MASVSFSVVFIIGALGVMITLAKMQRIYVFGNAEIVIIWLIFFWSGLEIIDTSGRINYDFSIILEVIPLLLALMASRLHLKLFGDASNLLEALIHLSVLLVLSHTILLIMIVAEIPQQFTVISEVKGRNGLAILGPLSLWMLACFPLKNWTPFGHRYNLILLLFLTNVLLNSSRMGFIILIWSVFVGAIWRSPRIYRLLQMFLIPACFVLIVLVIFSFPIVQAINETGVWGVGDDAKSVFSRSYTNFMLLDKLVQNPLLGIGWVGVIETKAFGYMGHSLYVNVLTAYGSAGALAAICAVSFGLLSAQGVNREAAVHLLFFAILISSFVNEVFAYFGVMVALIQASKVQDTNHRQHNDLKNPFSSC
jgi:hypothetical protein